MIPVGWMDAHYGIAYGWIILSVDMRALAWGVDAAHISAGSADGSRIDDDDDDE